MPRPKKPTGRPAETAGAVVGTGGIVASIATHNWLALGVACAGYVPAAVTYLVAHGGVRGVFRSIWGGRS
jgi:hypothetical protein